MARRDRLEQLTERWRARHDARRSETRPPASADREALARAVFPYRSMAPAAYADAHGAEMTGFTYDDGAYADADLDAWLAELGRLLRERGVIRGG